eukprot:CAMPEP_0185567152 /NCGR_PEP_ID=MMETSP0434-20130131/515_1 /TAXON_ID=626734 ORGANISM="Favella taraikaensis, Strain Fe Narragansett Bay" /NCGR_SAMPLE_ID=MMETSP0434 /ASSEMBLY_ACC=CAM_ASM_000379 /LENGTH=48 /DNA_ID= /DNA_START= /DNA_END= /DNA_ORIENTATION=
MSNEVEELKKRADGLAKTEREYNRVLGDMQSMTKDFCESFFEDAKAIF